MPRGIRGKWSRIKWRVLICAAIVLVAALFCYAALRDKGARVPASVVYVIDGDTVIVDTQARKDLRIRLIGLDTPETVDKDVAEQPYGKEASDYTKARLKGASVVLEYDAETHDRYGRDLCYVWIGDELFNETLLRLGYARLLTFQANTRYLGRFTSAERAARRERAGLWGLD